MIDVISNIGIVLAFLWIIWMSVVIKFDGKYWYPQPGRQKATEKITKLALWSMFDCDAYFLWFPEGQDVGLHTDPVKDKEHHRLNITIKGFWTLKVMEDGRYVRYIQETFNYHKFRPDIQRHSAVFHHNSLVFSFGWVK